VSGLSVAAMLALLGGVLMAVGSVGPWVTTFVVSVSGTQGDGQITLAAAGAAIVFTVLASTRQGGGVSIALALVAGLAGGAVGVYDFNNIHNKLQGIERLGSVGWGLYAVIAGAALIVVGAAFSANAKR
jgi:hypothetical protein